MIHGQRCKGLVIVLTTCLASTMSGGSAGVLTLCAFSMLDAYAVGRAIDERGRVGTWEWLPSSMRCQFHCWNFHSVMLLVIVVSMAPFVFPLACHIGDALNAAIFGK